MERNSLLVSVLEEFGDLFHPGISEYALIRKLQSPPFSLFDENALRDPLGLFQCHFLIFNALYQLRDKWLLAQEGILTIHATRIQLLNFHEGQSGLATTDPLRAYYLDWNNFDSTCAEDVDALIAGFWEKMGGIKNGTIDGQAYQRARSVLQLPESEPITPSMVKKQYYRLQHQHHPDKGGEATEAKNLSWAYRVLQKSLGG